MLKGLRRYFTEINSASNLTNKVAKASFTSYQRELPTIATIRTPISFTQLRAQLQLVSFLAPKFFNYHLCFNKKAHKKKFPSVKKENMRGQSEIRIIHSRACSLHISENASPCVETTTRWKKWLKNGRTTLGMWITCSIKVFGQILLIRQDAYKKKRSLVRWKCFMISIIW